MSDPPSPWELLAHLPHAIKISLVEEWDSRSGVGRLLYPLWIVERAYVWSGLLCLGAFLCFLAWLLKPMRETTGDSEEVSEA